MKAISIGHEWRWRDVHALVNTDWHRRALVAFMAVVVALWLERLAQAVQVYLLGWPVAGVLGLVFPLPVHSEWLPYGFALAVLIGLVLLRPGFQGHAFNWWTIALGVQAWYQYEHLLLLIQAQTGSFPPGYDAPTGILQLVVPRLEMELFYNAAVFVPMVVAVVLHRLPRDRERADMWCTCAVRATAVTGPSIRTCGRGCGSDHAGIKQQNVSGRPSCPCGG